MFCAECGGKLVPGGKFCVRCGTPVPGEAAEPAGDPASEQETLAFKETAASLAPQVHAGMDGTTAAYRFEEPELAHTQGAEPHPGDREAAEDENSGAELVKSTPMRRASWKTWILPGVSAVLVAAAVTGDYLYQADINKKVDSWHKEGERLSLEGKYDDGLKRIELALEKRPSHPVLLNDRDVLKDAIKLKDGVSAAEKKAGAKKYDEALKDVGALQKTLKTRKGAVYEKLDKLAGEKEESFVVMQVKDGMAAKKSVADLEPYLARLKPYEGEAAKITSQLVKQKIADISYEKATKQMDGKEFGAALQTVEEAIKLDEKNAKLLALQKTINDRKEAFEKAEQQRIQKAMEAATKEDIRNRTEAVELIGVGASLDDYGNFVVSGTIRNKATRPISSVKIYFDILDQWGTAIYNGSMYVDPYYLGIGDEGTFTNSYYNDGSMASVNVTRMEWQLE